MIKKHLDTLQWLGVACILTGHAFNAVGGMDPWNIIAFLLGMFFFITWAIIVKNAAQIFVNFVSILISFFGLYRAFTG